MNRGFTLAEVVLAVVVLEVGVLGIVSTLALAARVMGTAELLERAALETERVADSLVATGVRNSGERRAEWGRLTWRVETDGRLVLQAVPARGGTFRVEHVGPVDGSTRP